MWPCSVRLDRSKVSFCCLSTHCLFSALVLGSVRALASLHQPDPSSADGALRPKESSRLCVVGRRIRTSKWTPLCPLRKIPFQFLPSMLLGSCQGCIEELEQLFLKNVIDNRAAVDIFYPQNVHKPQLFFILWQTVSSWGCSIHLWLFWGLMNCDCQLPSLYTEGFSTQQTPSLMFHKTSVSFIQQERRG